LSLQTILHIIAFLGKTTEEQHPVYPALYKLIEGQGFDSGILHHINAILDDFGQVRDNASEELARIRKSKHKLNLQAIKRIEQLLGEGKAKGYIGPDAQLSLREGRQVIPVSAAYKRKLTGVIYDQSATGQTVYIEPQEVFELNNQIRELELDERREIIRLMKEAANHIRPQIPELSACYHMLGQVDAIRAKARLAIEMEAFRPRIGDHARLSWINARHPLLYLAYKPLKKHVEPLTIDLDSEQRILVISGPNAGGKSVCLKTCGLLQYMLQCGLLLPMEDYSEAGIFDQIFIDIGDEQSLENDLSTYSSHLVNMNHFISHANQKTLFLIDEFGAGTEPRLGGAIAEAILKKLNDSQAMGVVTTHYANLKLLAGKQPGIVNGSMLFDTGNMKPLFRLKMGNPGSSFAFEIAQNIGLPPEILADAAILAGSQELDFDRQLQDLDVKKSKLDQTEKELRSADAFLSEMIDKYEKLNKELESRKKDIIIQARQEAKEILKGTNKLIENTIREIRESQAEKERTQQARKHLEKFASEQETHTKKTAKPPQLKKAGRPGEEPSVISGPVQVGDTVRMSGRQSLGEVIEVSGKHAVVSFGSIKFKTPLQQLEKIKKGSQLPPALPAGRSRTDFNLNEKAAAFSPQTDLRGMRAEEAISHLNTYIDSALLLGIRQVKILHGKGDGILRSIVRQRMEQQDGVKKYYDEHADRGGAGATIVEFK
jgi:DNA mismatch repair protein MutS2